MRSVRAEAVRPDTESNGLQRGLLRLTEVLAERLHPSRRRLRSLAATTTPTDEVEEAKQVIELLIEQDQRKTNHGDLAGGRRTGDTHECIRRQWRVIETGIGFLPPATTLPSFGVIPGAAIAVRLGISRPPCRPIFITREQFAIYADHACPESTFTLRVFRRS
jgi:hypothetical protein